MFNVNDRVEWINDPSKTAIVNSVLGSPPNQMLNVTFIEGGKGTILCNPDDVRLISISNDPWSNLANGRFYTYDDFVLNTILHKIQNTVDNTISSLKASKTLFKPHQFIPLIKLLNYQQKRLLIADEVGLGKTIEAGHILLELFARGLISKVLVICTKTLIPKWQQEMREKFGFPFEEVDTGQFLKKFDQKIPPEEFFGVINYDKFSANQKLREFTKKNHTKFDLIICDEVQSIRNRETKRYKAIEPLISNAAHVVFLSATPINNKIEDLYNLLRLLDPIRYFNNNNFENDNQINRPFIKALNELSNGYDMKLVAQELLNAEVTRKLSYGDISRSKTIQLRDLLQDDPLFSRVIQRLTNGDNSFDSRVLAQRDLTELNSINYLFTRTKKRDVEGISAIRQPHKCLVKLSTEEKEIFDREVDELHEQYVNNIQEGKQRQSGMLPVLTMSRMMASCLPAYLKRKNKYIPDFDAKYFEFSKVVNEIVEKSKKKVIVFAEFKDTLKYLAFRLKEEGKSVALITGENPDERKSLLERFQSDGSLNILLASRVGTEGIDLQFCDALINYDLPWNPMVLEQRIGRIDRIGQNSPLIHIYNMVVHGSIEQEVYDRLLMKIRIFEESIGVLEAILSSDELDTNVFENLELELYTQRLTEEQKQQKLDQLAISLINQREDIKKIESELTDAMVQDHYFRDEINKIVRNERYVTPSNLVNYVEGLIRLEFREINIISKSHNSLVLKLNSHAVTRVKDYLVEIIRSSPTHQRTQLQLMYHEFVVLLNKDSELHLCFDNEAAFNDKKLHYVSPYHPLIYAATRVFESKSINNHNAYKFTIDRSETTGITIDPGLYLLTIGEIEIKKKWLGLTRTQRLLNPFVADLNHEEIRMLGPEYSEELYKYCQSNQHHGSFTDEIPSEAVDVIRYEAALSLEAARKEINTEETLRLDSAKIRFTQQFEGFYDWQIQVRKETLARGAGIEAILRKEIDDLESEFDRKMKGLEDSSITTSIRELLVVAVEVK